ncbi:restriction endonuclease subunit S [Vibrio harveyi]|uniref:restriction endonuclease subunit S n=1 Tax=Vibrio harveyi TaxID=669 RepID=UPI0023800C42|nr:restriction endonuclease subunit S [Vibrio harveyi]
MTGRYKAYPEYKDSGVNWLHDIPAHWKTIPVGRCYRRVKRTGFEKEELLSVYRDHGVVPKSSRDDNNNKPSDDLSPYQLVCENNLVMNKMKAWQGSIAISEFRGIVSPAYFVYEPLKQTDSLVYPKYVHYLLRHPIYITQYMSRSKGIRVNQWDLDPDEFQSIELLLPHKDEQKKVINFLDHETAKIDTLITKQEKLIELLKEKRQAVISHAVTKGLNPDAPMKDSGVEWLGEVPEHWDVKKLSSCSKITRLAGYEYTAYWKATESGEIIAIRGQNIRFNKLIELDKTERISTSLSERLSRSKLYCGDIAYPCVGTIGYAVLIEENDKYHINQNIAKLTPTDRVDPLYLTYFLNSKICLESALFLNTSDAQPSILVGNLRKVKIALPNLEEQNLISHFLQRKLKKLDEVSDKALISIDLMKERKTALVSAAVTGKIDLRDWQPQGVQG